MIDGMRLAVACAAVVVACITAPPAQAHVDEPTCWHAEDAAFMGEAPLFEGPIPLSTPMSRMGTAENYCPDSGIKRWLVTYTGNDYGTFFIRTEENPVGDYTSSCYGTPQVATVSAGPGDTFIIQPEQKCFDNHPDTTGRNCIYCSECPPGKAITVSRASSNQWVSFCGEYEVALTVECLPPPPEVGLSAGPGNPDGPLTATPGALNTLASAQITSDGGNHAVTLSSLTFELSWPEGTLQDVQVQLERDVDCNGIIETRFSFPVTAEPSVTFDVSDSIPESGGTLCYILLGGWAPEGCVSCGEAQASISPSGVVARSNGEPLEIGGETVIGTLELQAPGVQTLLEPERHVDAGDEVELVVGLLSDCTENWEARFEICDTPDGATGQGFVDGDEPLLLPFDGSFNDTTATFIAGDRPGIYTICVTAVPAEGGPTCGDADPDPFEIEVQVGGLTVTARHDGDETEGFGTFITDINAPNHFEAEVGFPPDDPRSVVRVDFDLDGDLTSDTREPFELEADMADIQVDSLLTVTVELSDGTIIEEVFDVFALPIAQWVDSLNAQGAAIDYEWEEADERYAFTVRDYPRVSWNATLPSDIPLVGGSRHTGELDYALGAYFHITQASEFKGLFEVQGEAANAEFTATGEAFAEFDPEFVLLPGAYAKARSELEVDLGRFIFRAAETPVLGIPLELELLLGAQGELSSFSMTQFDQEFGVEHMVFMPQLDAFAFGTASLSGQNDLAELAASVRVCAEVDGKLSYASPAEVISQDHLGGSVMIRVEVLGSVFWQESERAGELAAASFGPFPFGDGLLGGDGGISILVRCAGEGPGGKRFFPRAALDADLSRRVLLVRTVDVSSEEDASPNPEIAVMLNEGEGFGEELRITDNDAWEMDPDVALLNEGRALAVWTSNRGERSLETLTEIQSHQEISAATFDGESWSEEVVITHDGQADGAPQVAWDRLLGQALIVWLHDSASGNPADRSGTSLKYATYSPNDGFGAVGTIPGTDGGARVLQPRIVADRAGRFVVAWIRDEDGRLVTEVGSVQGGSEVVAESDDTDVVFAVFNGETWGDVGSLTPTDGRSELFPILSRRHDGKIAAMWVSRGADEERLELSRLDPETGEVGPIAVLARSTGAIESPRIVVGDDGGAKVAFRRKDAARDELFSLDLDLSAEEGQTQRAIPGAVGDAPRAITRDGGAAWAPAMAQSSDGRIWMAWARTDGDTGERGGLAERLSPGIHLAPLGGGLAARLSTGRRLTERLDGQGRIEALDFDVDIDVFAPGTFDLRARLYDRFGRPLSATATGMVSFEEGEEGGHTLGLSFDATDIAAGGVDGPFTIGDLTLIDHRFSPVAVDIEDLSAVTEGRNLDAFTPGRLTVNDTVFTGEDDGLTVTVNDNRFEAPPTLQIFSSAMGEPMAVGMTEVAEGRFEASVGFSTEATASDIALVEPAGIIEATIQDAEGRTWTEPVGWLPPSLEPFSLNVDVRPARAGRVVGEGIDCPRDCFQTVLIGGRVRLEAVPEPGFELAGWEGACSGDDDCTFFMNDASEVVARFRVADDTPQPTPQPTEAPTSPPIIDSPTPQPTPTPPAEVTPTPGTTQPPSTPTAAPTEGDGGDGGCGCRHSGGGATGMAWMLALLGAVVAGRRRLRAPATGRAR